MGEKVDGLVQMINFDLEHLKEKQRELSSELAVVKKKIKYFQEKEDREKLRYKYWRLLNGKLKRFIGKEYLFFNKEDLIKIVENMQTGKEKFIIKNKDGETIYVYPVNPTGKLSEFEYEHYVVFVAKVLSSCKEEAMSKLQDIFHKRIKNLQNQPSYSKFRMTEMKISGSYKKQIERMLFVWEKEEKFSENVWDVEDKKRIFGDNWEEYFTK